MTRLNRALRLVQNLELAIAAADEEEIKEAASALGELLDQLATASEDTDSIKAETARGLIKAILPRSLACFDKIEIQCAFKAAVGEVWCQ